MYIVLSLISATTNNTQQQNVRLYTIKMMGRMWKEVIWAVLQYCPSISLQKLRRAMKNIHKKHFYVYVS
jgi:hypothetical protein